MVGTQSARNTDDHRREEVEPRPDFARGQRRAGPSAIRPDFARGQRHGEASRQEEDLADGQEDTGRHRSNRDEGAFDRGR